MVRKYAPSISNGMSAISAARPPFEADAYADRSQDHHDKTDRDGGKPYQSATDADGDIQQIRMPVIGAPSVEPCVTGPPLSFAETSSAPGALPM